MRSIQTSNCFPLASVKPLENLINYRNYCLAKTKQALSQGTHKRTNSPIDKSPLEFFGNVEGFEYLHCPKSGSIFLSELPDPLVWGKLLSELSQYRRSPKAFHTEIVEQRQANVYTPKLEWIGNTLRIHGLNQPRLLEVATPPSDFTPLLQSSGLFAEVETVEEVALSIQHLSTPPHPTTSSSNEQYSKPVQAVVLLEALDRVEYAKELLLAVAQRLEKGGIIFITAQVSTGFDIGALGVGDMYFYPPDRTNCFSLQDLELLLTATGYHLVEISTPGVLDVEIVKAHQQLDPQIPLSTFERQIIEGDDETRQNFQTFLQQNHMSSFARIVGRKL